MEYAYIDIETTFDIQHEKEQRFILGKMKFNNQIFDIDFEQNEKEMINDFWRQYLEIGCPDLMAHNGINFDFKYLLKFQKIKGIRQRGCSRKPYALEFYNYNKKCIWYDSIALVPVSLKKIGEALNTRKKEADFYLPDEPVDLNSIKYKKHKDYCEQDVNILSNIGKFYPAYISPKKTCASTAFNFLFNVNRIKRFSEPAPNLSYRGGYTECLKAKAKDVSMFDINSSYANVMQKIANPYISPLLTKDRDKKNAGIYYIEIDKMNGLISPFSIKENNKLKYANFSNSKFWCASADLNWLDEQNISYTIKLGYEVPYLDMRNKIRSLFKLRKSPHLNYPIKLILNSSYGKFGQKDGIETVIISTTRLTDGDIGALLNQNELGKHKLAMHYIEDGLHTYIFHIDTKCRHRNILVCANITASAKINLLNYIKIAGEDNVIYCDTDSLLVNEDGRNALNKYVGGELGQLKNESEAEKARVYARKCYYLDGEDGTRIRFKGVPKYLLEDTQIEEINEYESVASFSGWREATMRETLKTNIFHSALEKKCRMNLKDYRDFKTPFESKPYQIELTQPSECIGHYKL